MEQWAVELAGEFAALWMGCEPEVRERMGLPPRQGEGLDLAVSRVQGNVWGAWLKCKRRKTPRDFSEIVDDVLENLSLGLPAPEPPLP